MEDISLLRAELDVINEQLVDVLKRRFDVTERVGRYKAEKELPLIDMDREKVMFEEIRVLAIEKGLEQEYAEKIFRVIVDCVYAQHISNGVT
jgi:chorismate mutase